MSASVPGSTLGVVGGGQLGRMLGEAASPLGVDVVVLDPTPDAPASRVAEQIVGGFDDVEAIRELAERADVLTFEIELADAEGLADAGEATGVPVHPAPETLSLIEDKLVQKKRLEKASVPVPAFRQVDSLAELEDALDELGCPAMLKARQGGYDGRGNVAIHAPDEAEAALEAIAGPAMVEAFVDYERELATIGCIGADERDLFAVTETIHEAEILRETVTPARAGKGVRDEAREVAHDVLDQMTGRGVYGIEMFETSDGEVLLNEIAPRPHNSGHWTIEGALTSQFEQHVRAVLGLPLGSTALRGPTVSANILGDVDAPQPAQLRGVDAVLETPGAALHWYGKREVRPLRKMGHVTLSGPPGGGTEKLLRRIHQLRDGWTFRTASDG